LGCCELSKRCVEGIRFVDSGNSAVVSVDFVLELTVFIVVLHKFEMEEFDDELDDEES